MKDTFSRRDTLKLMANIDILDQIFRVLERRAVHWAGRE
jgi:hypothetical protein